MTEKKVLVFGATGNIGGAASRELLERGWYVRAVSRNPNSNKALTIARLGAEVVEGDMDKRETLEAAFDGIQRVFSVQNWSTSGTEGEIRQGKLVADVAREAGVEHLVYGSAGINDPNTGVPHFNSKLIVEAYMRSLGLPFTIVRPGPFMELLTEKEFFPPLAAWGAQVKVLGWDKPIPWVAVKDIGTAIANIFEDHEKWVGKDVTLIGDVKTMREVRESFVAQTGKTPFRLSLPLPIFNKMAGEEFVIMWKWLDGYQSEKGPKGLLKMVEDSHLVNPQMQDLDGWLKSNQNGR